MLTSNKPIKTKPSISVIIPCYNAESTIKVTLESLERQSFKDFEVILVNDGSTDGTHVTIEKKLKEKPLDINYIIQENSGVSVARNRGLNEAKGDFITFLDADDVYHKDFLKILFENIAYSDVDTVVCCYSRNIEAIQNSSEIKSYDVLELERDNLLEFFMYRKGPSSFFTFIYKKKILDDFQIYFNPCLKYGEDLEFIWSYLIHSKRGLFVNEEMYGYYDNPNSVMNNISWRITDVLTSIENIEKILYERGDAFYSSYKNYMFSRALWALLKDFSLNGNKANFYKLSNEYDTKKSLKELQKITKDWRIKYTSKLFMVNETLFYIFFRLIYLKKRLGVRHV